MDDSRQTPYRILVVEDHLDTLRAMGALLRSPGYAISSAQTCSAALEQVREHPFDLLLTDFTLTDGNGIDLFNKISESTPIEGILVSGYDRPQDERRSLLAGFARYLIKPVDVIHMFETIQAVRDQHLRRMENSPVKNG